MSTGSFSLLLVLHAHLPFVRHPEHARHLEEEWLFEAISESYLPLLDACERMADDGVDFRLTLSLSPTLCEMLADPLLQARYLAHVERLIELMGHELARYEAGSPLKELAQFYHACFARCREQFETRHRRNILHGFKRLQDSGHLEIITCAATHGLLPLMLTREARRAQILIARENYIKHFGRPPRGIWLPEAAYAKGVDTLLREAEIDYFFLDTHGLLFAEPPPRYGVYRPVRTPAGVAAFGRDVECSKEVWSSEAGYPGDGVYREFYRDLGFDAEYESIKDYLHDDGVRRGLGIKYHKVTGRVPLHEKELYRPSEAARRAEQHAGDFLAKRRQQLRWLADNLDVEPLVVAPYDAELFGHWWFEGPHFLESFLRQAANSPDEIHLTTPSAFLSENNHVQVVSPCASSWGEKGYYEVWLNAANEWIYPLLHRAETRMIELARRFDEAAPLQRRALNQVARELLLAQASDWAFMMSAKTSVEYAERRTRDHLGNFDTLHRQLVEDRLDESNLAALERKNSIFSEIDYRVYQ